MSRGVMLFMIGRMVISAIGPEMPTMLLMSRIGFTKYLLLIWFIERKRMIIKKAHIRMNRMFVKFPSLMVQ